MSGFVPETNFAQGASGASNVYDTTPAGLGLSPSYLSAGATASASASLASSILTGHVSAAGAADRGTGYSAALGLAGEYTITFTTAFAMAPIVTASVDSNTGADLSLVVANVSATGFAINTFNQAGTKTSAAFYFIVVATQ